MGKTTSRLWASVAVCALVGSYAPPVLAVTNNASQTSTSVSTKETTKQVLSQQLAQTDITKKLNAFATNGSENQIETLS